MKPTIKRTTFDIIMSDHLFYFFSRSDKAGNQFFCLFNFLFWIPLQPQANFTIFFYLSFLFFLFLLTSRSFSYSYSNSSLDVAPIFFQLIMLVIRSLIFIAQMIMIHQKTLLLPLHQKLKPKAFMKPLKSLQPQPIFLIFQTNLL